jgi:hypothetical protein
MDAQYRRVRYFFPNDSHSMPTLFMYVVFTIVLTVFSVDPCDLSSPVALSVLPALSTLACLAADLCANQVSSYFTLTYVV